MPGPVCCLVTFSAECLSYVGNFHLDRQLVYPDDSSHNDTLSHYLSLSGTSFSSTRTRTVFVCLKFYRGDPVCLARFKKKRKTVEDNGIACKAQRRLFALQIFTFREGFWAVNALMKRWYDSNKEFVPFPLTVILFCFFTNAHNVSQKSLFFSPNCFIQMANIPFISERRRWQSLIL